MTTTIIGGGVAGLATAWALARVGQAVRVLEAGRFGSGTTHHAAGMLAPTNELEPTERELLLAGLQSKARYEQWARDLPDFGFD
ncbi:MAG: FAD-dependent oxidoreductase, partial [Bacteroidota bacterium]